MKLYMGLFAALITGLLVGCNDAGNRFDAPVEVKGQVKLSDGKPVTDVKVTFNPMDRGLPVTPKLDKEGKFTASIIPGKYSYVVEPADGKPAAFRLIPEKYHTPSADHTVQVESGKDIALTLQK